MPLKIISWNIEHFDGKGGGKTARKKRVDRVVQYMKDQKPDIFGISEVKGKAVYQEMTDALSGYSFVITEGPQTQEILIGVREGLRSFFSQREEFKSGNPGLRPGGVMTVTHKNQNIPIMFVHFKSMPTARGMGLRNDMVEHAINLKKALDKIQNTQANFIVIGDMNFMGMNIKDGGPDFSGAQEIGNVENRFARYGMVRLKKDHSATFFNGSKSKYPPSDLDHVFAADHLKFEPVKNGNGALVHVGGWAELTSVTKKDDWINKFSDHAPLVLTLKI